MSKDYTKVKALFESNAEGTEGVIEGIQKMSKHLGEWINVNSQLIYLQNEGVDLKDLANYLRLVADTGILQGMLESLERGKIKSSQ